MSQLTDGTAALRRCLSWSNMAPLGAASTMTPSALITLLFCAGT